MIKTSTQNELLQYVYNELDEAHCKQLEAALMHDEDLAEECAELLISKQELDGLTCKPGFHVISNILNYSKSLSLQLNS